MASQKIMIEESMMVEVKNNEKLTITKVVLDQLGVKRDCMVLKRSGAKADTYQIRYINNDNTIDQMEIKFKGKSLTIEKCVVSTNEFNLLDPYREISRVDVKDINLNTQKINLGGLYVPAVVIMTPFIIERANSKTTRSVVKESFNIIGNKRMNIQKSEDDKNINMIFIDLNVYKTGDKKPVDLTKNTWQRLGCVLTDVNDNEQCIEIYKDSIALFEKVENVETGAEEINSQRLVNDKKVDEKKDEDEDMENNELMDKVVNRVVEVMTELQKSTEQDTMMSIIKLACGDDADIVKNLKGFRTLIGLELNDESKDAETVEEFTALGKVMSLIGQKFACLENEEQKGEYFAELVINQVREEFKDEEGIDDITKEDVINAVKDMAKVPFMNRETVEKEDTKEEMVAEEVDNKEEVEETVSKEEEEEDKQEEVIGSVKLVNEAKKVKGRVRSNKSDDKFELGIQRLILNKDDKEVQKEDHVMTESEICQQAALEAYRLIHGIEESTEEEEEKEVVKETAVEHKELTKSVLSDIDELCPEGHVVHNSLLKYCVFKEDGDIEMACKKYEQLLNFVEDKLEPKAINKLSTEYHSVEKAMNKYTSKQLKSDIMYDFDYVHDLVEALYTNVPGYGNIKSVLGGIDTDLAANIIFSLCNRFDRTLESMCFDEKVKFYTVFRDLLDIKPIDVVNEKEVSKLVQKSFTVAVNFKVNGQACSTI